MGYRRVPTIHTLDNIEGEEGLIVRLKSIKIGKLRRLMTLTASDDTANQGLEQIFDLLQDAMVSWNLEDEEGQPVPATAEGLEDQEAELILRIVEAWMEVMTGVSTDLGKGSSSGESFPGRPLTMEAL
jgi:hypothetical protein